MQRNNRHSSMSIYLAALTIPDSIVLSIGRYDSCRLARLEIYNTFTETFFCDQTIFA